MPEGILGEVDGGEPGEQPSVGELGDLCGQERARGIRRTLVPAEPGKIPEILAESGDVGRLGEIGGCRDEEGAAVVAPRHGVDVGAPGRRERPGSPPSRQASSTSRRGSSKSSRAPVLGLDRCGAVAAGSEAPDLLGDALPRSRPGGSTATQPATDRAAARSIARRRLVSAWERSSTGSAGAGRSTPSYSTPYCSMKATAHHPELRRVDAATGCHGSGRRTCRSPRPLRVRNHADAGHRLRIVPAGGVEDGAR